MDENNFVINGKKWDIQGKKFEKLIEENIQYSKKNLKNEIFEMFLNKLHLNINAISKLESTSSIKEIGRLPSGGLPKTDVLVKIISTDGSEIIETISCKKTSRNMVTVHQYSANDFAYVLDKNNKRLMELLNIFQKYGNKRDLPDGIAEELEKELKPYLEKLIKWALFGEFGEGNKKQIAKYIITCKNDDIKMYTAEEYYNKICNITKMFGTPFQWTYQSKGKGKSIQLKLPIF